MHVNISHAWLYKWPINSARTRTAAAATAGGGDLQSDLMASIRAAAGAHTIAHITHA